MAQVPSQEKMNVYFKVTKTLAMEVNRTHTVRDVKAMLAEKEGTPQVLQQLSFCGNQMENGRKIADYGVTNNSTINVSSLAVKLHVKIVSTQETIVVDAKRSDSIQNVKFFIESTTERIRRNEYALYHNGKLLEDGISLASLDLLRDSNFQLVPSPRDVLWVLVEAPERETKRLQVMLLHTVSQVKVLAENVMNLPPANWQIHLGGVLLEESKTLAYHEIEPNAVLTLFSSPCRIQIFVSIWSGKILTLELTQLDTISDVKHMISVKTSVPTTHLWLMYAGKVLMDDRDLASYNIQKESTLFANRRGNYSFLPMAGEILECSKMPTQK